MLATLVDAALKPLAARLLRVGGLPEPWVMRAEGGVVPLADVLARPLGLVGSGPAAGALAVARAAAGGDAIGLDIGSTTTEVSLHRAGAPLGARGTWLGAMWLRGAALDVESLPLGGETVLPCGATLRAAMAEDGAALREVVAWLAEAVRRIAFRRDLDPARARLVVGGGAGVHLARAVAAELGARELVVPPRAELLAATGLAAAPAMAREEMACDLGRDGGAALAAEALAQAGRLRARCAGWGLGAVAIRHELDLAPGPRAEPVAHPWTPGLPIPGTAARIVVLRGIATAALP
jgi:N-methylhydantoinase A